ncbi:tryptophan synthase [Liquorilactobacillus sucicola DSM 21376 = JCM 15457]|uniref:Tryptophan synthase alpha chain n=1 Tax=Liquorilactobacillus sucicola DSM 21376 = JCM 15457 TaxID=1423806 RepID=A0A0R2E020_9LACO|nr:tryptophan synthase subunit alpha [Liquorilactobacillus sucicola]KRN07221.1 tryptophan synthase [Liquorilactobacillus sucicola DSM 21376 = JCM 15457]
MTNISDAFKNKKAFIGFTVACDPNFTKSIDYVKTLAKAGTDIVEIGVPFSDPVADGPVIQAAGQRAFKSGVSTKRVFEMVAKIREETTVPLVLLVYLNNVFKYGYARFFAACQQLKIGGVIIPDLPVEERAEVAPFAKKASCALIPLVAPTSGERIKKIIADTDGFIYAVSSLGVTGARNKITTDLKKMVSDIKQLTAVPVAVGFGVHSPEQAATISKSADGVIVGSAIVKIIAQEGVHAEQQLTDYVHTMKNALAEPSELI